MGPSESEAAEIAYQMLPFFRAYKDGLVERFFGTDVFPASLYSPSGVSSKDVKIASVSARLFLPSATEPHQKLPLLIYFHGGAFCFGSPFCTMYHTYLTSLVAGANVLAVSVDYRLAPEHPVPAAYEDSWAALKWVASHCQEQGPESWLNHHADFRRVFVAGDSAGANIAHQVAARAGAEGLEGANLVGAALVHPEFAGRTEVVSKSWFFACPDTTGWEDPRINPAVDRRLGRLGCRRVVVFMVERDGLREGGWFYKEALVKSGWDGLVDVVETDGEEHAFHLFNPTCDKALDMIKRLTRFIHQD